MPREVAHQYEHLGMEVVAFATIFRPDNGQCFKAMGDHLRELSREDLELYKGLEILHSITASGSLGLERVISWHRQPPDRKQSWLPYVVNEDEEVALEKITQELIKLDRVVQETSWNGLGGGIRFSQAITALRTLKTGTNLFRFNAGFGSLLHSFHLLALHCP